MQAPLQMDNAFARDTMVHRIPRIVRDVQMANSDYPPTIYRALDRLHDALVNDEPISMFDMYPTPPPDFDDWNTAYQAQRARIDPLTWQHTEWFFAETLFYRLLIQAVRWHETGRDPFAPKKQAELQSDHLWALLETALAVEGDFTEKMPDLLSFALWGNRVDLSHPAGSLAGKATDGDDLLVDDRDRVIAALTTGTADPARAVHIVADNAGTELAMDMVLADALLADGWSVVLHLKAYPTYVSDATIPDVWQMLDAMITHGFHCAALADRLWRAWAEERFRLVAPPFWVSCHFLRDMPPTLYHSFEQAAFIILKGDMNYRRTFCDTLWPEGTSFLAAMDHFPTPSMPPMVALRSIKCDVLVGVSSEVTRTLDARDKIWRVTGQYGVIQLVYA